MNIYVTVIWTVSHTHIYMHPSTHTPLTFDLHMGTVATLTSLNNVPLLTSVDVVPLMKTAVVVENSGHCMYCIGLRCFEIDFRCFN